MNKEELENMILEGKHKKYHEYTEREKQILEKMNNGICVYCGEIIEGCFLACDKCGYLEDKALDKVD